MKYGLAVFDLDGTVLNTLFDLYKATDYALFENGFDKRSEDEVRRFVGNGIHKLIAKMSNAFLKALTNIIPSIAPTTQSLMTAFFLYSLY